MFVLVKWLLILRDKVHQNIFSIFSSNFARENVAYSKSNWVTELSSFLI